MGYTDFDVLKMPIRRRRKMEVALSYYLEEEAKANKKGAGRIPSMPRR